MGRRDRYGQQEKPSASPPARRRPEQTRRAKQLEHAADQHCGAWPGNVRRHDAHLGVCCDEMRHAADGEPEEDKYKAGHAAPAEWRVCRACVWR